MWIREMIIKFRFGLLPIYILGLLSISIFLCFLSYPFFEYVSLANVFQLVPNKISLYTNENYSVLNLITAILLIGVFGLSITVLLGMSAAILLSEFVKDRIFEKLKIFIDYIELVPPVLFGYLLLLLNLEFTAINEHTFYNIAAFCIIFGLMMLPSITSKFITILKDISYEVREGVYSLGATKYETAFMVLLPMKINVFLAETIKILGRTVSEILIILLVAGFFTERLEVILTILVLTIFTVIINQYLMKKNQVHE
jgi:phosphate transport system permease protein